MSSRFSFSRMPDAVVSIRDTMIVEDPWGFGLRFEVLRADAEDCRAWDEAHPESGYASLHTRGALASMMSAGATDKARLITDLADAFEARSGNLLQGDMERGRRKVAMVVIRAWWGVMVEGVEVPYAPLLALEYLGFRGVAWREKGAAALVVKTANEWDKIADTSIGRQVQALLDGKSSKTIDFAQRFTGEFRDDAGEVLVIPRLRKVGDKLEPNPHGGHPFGQALTMFLLEKSNAAAAFSAKAEEADLEAFPPSPDTARASGGASGSSASSSESEPSADSSAATPAAPLE